VSEITSPFSDCLFPVLIFSIKIKLSINSSMENSFGNFSISYLNLVFVNIFSQFNIYPKGTNFIILMLLFIFITMQGNVKAMLRTAFISSIFLLTNTFN